MIRVTFFRNGGARNWHRSDGLPHGGLLVALCGQYSHRETLTSAAEDNPPKPPCARCGIKGLSAAIKAGRAGDGGR